MKKIVFTEEFCQPENLFPFTLTRQVQDLRVGICTIRQKWEHCLGIPSFDKFENDYKDGGDAVNLETLAAGEVVYLIHGNVLPTKALVKKIKQLKPGNFIALRQKEGVVYCVGKEQVLSGTKIKVEKALEFRQEVQEIVYPWQIFQLNAAAITQDFEWITAGRKSQKISRSNKLIGKNVFVEAGATLEHCIINTTDGPVYIGKNATVMEGSMLRGPIAICENATVKMGAKIYGGTTIGPNCVAGGEIKNSVLMGFSNKAHDGYLGDSVIGAWCNLGAGTSNSNLKNNASSVAVWTPGGLKSAGSKCGVIMGDYSRTAINTSINTGTVIGVCCNVFGSGLTPKHISSFSWGSDGVERYQLNKAFADIENWKALKQQKLTEAERKILKHIFDHY